MEAIGRWWDGVELWLIGLPFALQALVVMTVLIPVCAFAAICADTVVNKVFGLCARARGRGPVGGQGGPKAGADRPRGTESEDY